MSRIIEVDRGFLEHLRDCFQALREYNNLNQEDRSMTDAICDMTIDQIEELLYNAEQEW